MNTKKKLEEPYPALQKIITQNYDLIQIKELLLKISKSNLIDSFLLLGETGTGKELFAKAIHEISGRSGAFIPVSCASIPDQMFESEIFGHVKGAFTGATYDKKGFFEQADGGTIFLDEIGEFNSICQVRLLRVLQDRKIIPVGGKIKKVDFQLVSATNRNLREMVDEGKFREDLYRRINEYTIPIPALAERKNDISLLAQHFVEKFDTVASEDSNLKTLSIDEDCLNVLENYHWRGNVRELESVCKLVMAFRSPEDRSKINASEFKLKKIYKQEDRSKINASEFELEKAVETKKRPRKFTPLQVVKQCCQARAQQLWEKSPDLTIRAVIKTDELLSCFDGTNIKLKKKRTLHDWVKEFCPNRAPGRRPGT